MGESLRAVPLRYLTTKQAAEYLRLGHSCLEKMRSRGGGPRFRRHCRRVVYAVAELDAWSDARVMDCTADSDPNRDIAAVDREGQ